MELGMEHNTISVLAVESNQCFMEFPEMANSLFGLITTENFT